MAKIAKKVEKLEKKADGLRRKAEKKGQDLQAVAANGDKKGGGRKGMLALLLAAGAGVAVAMKRKRDQELDEALWEEPRSI